MSAVWIRHRRPAAARVLRACLIALTAPERWAIDQVGRVFPGRSGGRGFGRFRGRGGDWPPPAGVREPRRPSPGSPASAIALAEPEQQHRVRLALEDFPRTLSEPARRARSYATRLTTLLLRSVRRLHLRH